MFLCYICGRHYDTAVEICSHLRSHELFGELHFPIKCCFDGCSADFSKICNVTRHMEKYHQQVNYSGVSDVYSDSKLATMVPVCDTVTATVVHHSVSNVEPPNDTNISYFAQNAVENEAAALVASLRANSSMPHSVISEIILSCQKMLTQQAAQLQQVVTESLDREGQTQMCSTVATALQSTVRQNKKQLDNFATTYKQDRFFEAHPLFVKPCECTFGSQYEVVRGENKLVYDTYQYISIEGALRSLMHNNEYVAMLLQNNCHSRDGIMREYQDGIMFRDASYDPSKVNIFIQIFYDSMGTSNPLRGQSSLCNVGVFCFVVKNLPTSQTTCHANVHLFALCYTHDLRVYGYESILEKFVSEMENLRVNGFEGTFALIGRSHVYVHFTQAVCDNLALNGLLGSIECFSADYFCTMCMATQSAIQNCFP
jgi:hypothetical protein